MLPYCENDCGLSGAEWDEKATDSAYSPDLALSDFCLFGHAKQLLGGHEFADLGALLDAVQDFLRGINKITLDRVFLAWMGQELMRFYRTLPIFFN
jgi:hypothetical protein